MEEEDPAYVGMGRGRGHGGPGPSAAAAAIGADFGNSGGRGRGRGRERRSAAAAVGRGMKGCNPDAGIGRARNRAPLGANVSQAEIEYVWNHGEVVGNYGAICGYCHFYSQGGGATRFRCHLAGLKRDVRACLSVPSFVRDAMTAYVQRSQERKQYNDRHKRHARRPTRRLKNVNTLVYKNQTKKN